MRRVESVFRFAMSSVMLAACAGGSVSTPATAPVALSGPVEIPQSVGAFRLLGARAVQGAPNDTNYRFDNGAGLGISVFRYAIPDDVRVDGDTLEWIRREGQKFAAVQRILVSRGVADSMKMRVGALNAARSDFPLAEHVGVAQTWSARRGTMLESEYLYVVDGRFLKIRGSEKDAIEGTSEVAQFARQLLQAIVTAASAGRAR
jgi:hypothetical protein